MSKTWDEEGPSREEGKDKGNGSGQTRSPPPVSFAVGIAALRRGFQTVRHQSGKRHSGEAGCRRGIVPTAAKVNASFGERIHKVFHDRVKGDDAGKEGVEMAPSPGAV